MRKIGRSMSKTITRGLDSRLGRDSVGDSFHSVPEASRGILGAKAPAVSGHIEMYIEPRF